MKKLILSASLLIALASTVWVIGCADKKDEEMTLYEHGLDMISLMDEMAENESYFSLFSSDSEIKVMIEQLGAHKEPAKVYKLTVSDEQLFGDDISDTLSGLSESLRSYLSSRSRTSVATFINAKAGTDSVSASSILSVTRSFVNTEADNDTVYLYTYEDSVPAVITFNIGEDGAVSAVGHFIFNDKFDTSSADSVKEYLAAVQIEAEEIKK